jgi:hypothetical protein
MPAFTDTMRTKERELAEALRERLAIISDEASRRDSDQHMKRLRHVSERIDTLAAALPQPIPSRLAHFLERHSYDKAWEFLCSDDRS